MSLKGLLLSSLLLAAPGLAAGETLPSSGPPACALAPALDADFPDPSLFADPAAGRLLAFGTNVASPGGGLINVPVSEAPLADLRPWSSLSDALPRLPGWARPGFTWAPSLAHREGGPYRLYFTARYGLSGRPCIGVATAADPKGPFVPTNEVKPLVCPLAEGGAIDPSVFSDTDGAEYLLWKTDANCCEGEPAIEIQKLAPDGLALEGEDVKDAPFLLPDAKVLLRRDAPSEGRVIEGPVLRRQGDLYVLIYSVGSYLSDSYGVGYALSPSLFGPYRKSPEPLLSAAGLALSGPGGADVLDLPTGDRVIAFHAWREGAGGRYRALYLGRLGWENGAPKFIRSCPVPVGGKILAARGLDASGGSLTK